ncbi:MAG TPA: hypothetical protein VJ840_00950 [Gemmatimonadaceae bacterium]|nr:hypothetical protein [Gemmatimonadaceae bacterium]
MSEEQVIGDSIPADCELIQIRTTELRQLFNPIDPSPLPERDLESKAEDFIVSWARASRSDARFALQIRVERQDASDKPSMAGEAIREYFRQKSLSAHRRLQHLFRVGRTSLLIGVLSLAVAVVLAQVVERLLSEIAVGVVIRESVIIGGWVAMWRPLEIFLYDWWPIRAERQLYDRLSTMPVRITYLNPAG